MSTGAQLRAEAARVLAAVLFDGRSLKAVLADALQQIPDSRDRALLEAICFSALRHHRRYEFAISQWLAKPLGARDASVHALLLVGLAQIDALQLPAHAAVASTAEAARLLGRTGLVGLVNAVLRKALREGLPNSDNLAIQTSHPDWLIDQLKRDWPDQFEEIFRANNQVAPLWLRVNTAVMTRENLHAQLQAQSLAVHMPDFPAGALVMEDRVSPTQLPGWQQGAFAVQDGAAQLAVTALAPQAGERVLDACAAPGGKTAQIAAELDNGELVALDNDARRLRKVSETLQRFHLMTSRVQLHVADATDTTPWWDGRAFDAILLDAPCSATGIIRRQPDIKWNRRADDIPALAALQSRLLDALWPTLKPGGRFLYATCSILKEENAHQIAAFMARTADAHMLSLDQRFGQVSGAGRQRLPGEDGMDGFFYALMGKSRA